MAKYRVLIVDDQRDMRRVLRSSIEALDERIDVADVPSGEEAILVISRQPVDLLISDVRLPGISGLELKERSEVRNPNLKFILVTGVTDPKLRHEVAEAHADAYFYKPIDIPEFLNAVLLCLGISGEPISVDMNKKDGDDSAIEGQVFDEPPSLSKRLGGLRQELGALTAVLIDDQGNILAQAGTLPDEAIAQALISSLATVCSAALKVSQLLGVKHQRDFFYVSGTDYDVIAAHVGVSGILFVITSVSDGGIAHLAPLMGAIRSAVQDLLLILADIGVDMEQLISLLERPAPVDEEEEVNINEVVQELDTIFEKASSADFSIEEVDAFWESASTDDGEADHVTRADVISYDQAQRLGLAPEED